MEKEKTPIDDLLEIAKFLGTKDLDGFHETRIREEIMVKIGALRDDAKGCARKCMEMEDERNLVNQKLEIVRDERDKYFKIFQELLLEKKKGKGLFEAFGEHYHNNFNPNQR